MMINIGDADPSGRIIVTGGTGFVGKVLCCKLSAAGYDVVVLSRDPAKARGQLGNRVTVVEWDAKSAAGWSEYLDGALGIVNLAGENIGSGYWTRAKKQRILNSRVDAGRAVSEAIERAANRPKVLVQVSAVGYYGDSGDDILDERSSNGAGFLADVTRQWEGSTAEVEAAGVRRAVVRLGVVLGRGGGVLARMTLPFRFFVGGHFGSGDQWFSWVHIEDVAEAIIFLIETDDLAGPFNLVGPDPVRARDFCRILGNTLNRPSWLPVPGLILRLALGEMARELLLAGQRVIPNRLLEAGYEFRYPELGSALQDLADSRNI